MPGRLDPLPARRGLPSACRAWTAALLSMLVTAAALLALDRSEQARQDHLARTQVLERLSLVRAQLESHLNLVIASARSLAAIYATRPDLAAADYAELARVVADPYPSIINVGLVRGSVIRYVYPLAGNEKAIGLDLARAPALSAAFERMMKERRTIIAGPVTLVQGGTGIIVRIPVFRADGGQVPGTGDILGAISIPLDAEQVYTAAGLPLLERELKVALRGRDGLGEAGEVFRGDPATFERAQAVQEIVLPGGRWQIAAHQPATALPASLLVLRVAGTLLVLLVGLGSFQLTRQVQRRAAADAGLRAANTRLEAVLQAVPDLLFEFAPDGRYLAVWAGNQPGAPAYPVERLLGQRVDEVLPPAAAAPVMAALAEADAGGASRGRRFTLDTGLGERHYELSVAAVGRGADRRLVALARDVSERLHAEREMRIAATAFQSQDGMLILDAERRILRVNPAFTTITGYAAEEVIGLNPQKIRPGFDEDPGAAERREQLAAQGHWSGEIEAHRKNGERFPAWMTITAVRDEDGRVLQYVCAMADMTRRKEIEREIERLAFHDPLTGLPNRRLLTDRLRQTLAACARLGRQAALLFIDLDNFKSLNDTRGHDVGDLLLVEVAQRLSALVREGDTVARLGGDEFVVLIVGLDARPAAAAAAAQRVGEKISAAIARPFELRDGVHLATCSVGVRLFEHGALAEDLLKHADTAMYAAKSAGRNTVRFFDPAMEQALLRRSRLEADLRQALVHGQFELHAQLQVDRLDRPVGAELLLRWRHPQRGLVAPGEFIALAEEIGLIVPIGQWVLREAAALLQRWQDRPVLQTLALAVNVSSRQLHDPGFVALVEGVVRESGIAPTRLKLEITESSVHGDVDLVVGVMERLRTLGVGFSMDDFGTGYSSLQYLKRLPLAQLKIDRSFVRDLEVDANDQAIVRTIIAMARSMHLDVIAEGVETARQRELLDEAGCTRVQGYLVARPLPIEAFEARVLGPADVAA